MGEMIGANTTELRDMSTKMRSEADRLNQICTDLSGSFGRTYWEGIDGDEVRANWNFRWSGQLREVAGMLVAAANTLTKNAEQQDLASATDNAPASVWERIVRDTGLDFGPENDPAWKTALGVLGLADLGRSLLMTDTGEKLLDQGGEYLADAAKDGGKFAALAKDADTGFKDVGKFADSPFGRVVLANPEDLAKGASFAEHAGQIAKLAGPVAFLSLGGSVVSMVQHPDLHNGVDIAFNVAEIATAEFPPASIALSIAQLAYDNPHVVADIGKGIGNAAMAVGNAEVKLGSDVGHAAVDIASGGANALRHLVHW